MFFRRHRNLPSYVHNYLDAQRPNPRAAWRTARYVVLDSETTGLDPRRDALLALGLVEIIDGRIRLDRCWETLVRPPTEVSVPAASIRIHGLLRDELNAAPLLADVLPELLQRLCGCVLVVHVAALDVRFLQRALRSTYGIAMRGPALDTAQLAATLHHSQRFTHGYHSAQPTLALRALAEQAGLPVYAEHNALNDALTTAQLFLAQVTQFEQQGYNTLRHLIHAGAYLR